MKKAALNLIDFLKRDKKRAILAACALFGILIAIAFSQPAQEKSNSDLTLSEYKSQLENELSKMCSSVRGVGKCLVTVSFSEGESLEYKGSSLVGSKPPKVLGVCVICEGADKESVRASVSECMRSLFDIGANRISIMKMK